MTIRKPISQKKIKELKKHNYDVNFQFELEGYDITLDDLMNNSTSDLDLCIEYHDEISNQIERKYVKRHKLLDIKTICLRN